MIKKRHETQTENGSKKSHCYLYVFLVALTIALLGIVFALNGCLEIVKPGESLEETLTEDSSLTKETKSTESQNQEEATTEVVEESGGSSGEDTLVEEKENITESTSDAEALRIYSAILKAVDTGTNTLKIEQLINEPNERELGPEVKLEVGYKVYRIVVVRSDDAEKEYTKEISLSEVPLGVEIGLGFSEENLVNKIIYSELIDASKDIVKDEVNSQKGEYFAYAILKGVDFSDNVLNVEQLINEPNEKEIGNKVKLTKDYKVYRHILVKSEEGDREYTKEISLSEIPLGFEIGIILTKDNLARTVIFSEMIE